MKAILSTVAIAALFTGTAFAAPRKPQEPPKPPAIEKPFPTETTFRLVELNGKPVPRGVEATLLIDTAFRGQGTSGCNTWSAALWPVRGQRLMGGGVNTTRRSCPAPVMAFERSYLAALLSGATWDIVRDDLVVKSPRGSLRFQRGF
jgi:heat shock protein HslJ